MKKQVEPQKCSGYFCPVEITLNIISGKWKGVILYHLLGGKKRFNELKKMMKTVTHRSLTLQLRELERDGVVKRTVFAEVPPRVEYELTPLGLSMQPIIQAMREWGLDYQNIFLQKQQELSTAGVVHSSEK